MRLYRAMDEKNSPILVSKNTDMLSIHSMNGEMISHELWYDKCASMLRGDLNV